MVWKNPFADFIFKAELDINQIQGTSNVYSDKGLVPRHVDLTEKHVFVFDLIDRAKSLHYCFERLHDLAELYHAVRAEFNASIEQQTKDAPEREAFEISDEVIARRELLLREAIALVAFAYHEMSAIVTLLQIWFKPRIFEPLPSSDLEYLIGARNKLLVHPVQSSKIKDSDSGFTVGVILHAHVIGANEWVPLIRNHYLAELAAKGVHLNDQAGEQANRQLIRDRNKRVERLTLIEKLQLKAFNIPEPDPLASANELAGLLSQHFLPEVSRICRTKII